MGLAKGFIFVANGGSSSIKFSIFEYGAYLRKTIIGKLEGIGIGKSSEKKGLLTIDAEGSDPVVKHVSVKNGREANNSEANNAIIDWLTEFSKNHTLIAVGHRMVHGGSRYFSPQLITEDVLAELRNISQFDPDHLPGEIQLAETLHSLFPGIPHVACFDTAFHREMPTIAQLLPIPRRYFSMGIKRYGFHGLSCQYLIKTLGELAGTEAARDKVIIAHLGSGASITAVHEGKTVDTSMGLTPCSGLPMSSRAGDLDPGLALQLAQLENMDIQQFHDMVNHESGLKGVSNLTGNIHELLSLEKNNSHAADAVNYFCYHTRKWICSLAGAMGGVQTLIFSGGIGENLAEVRARICENLEFIGVVIDPEKNRNNNLIISTAASRITVRVIKTDEELMIANHIAAFLDQQIGSFP